MAVATAGAAITSLGKQAVESYANYEQLVGGVETLFKDSAPTIQEYAANAFKTAGLSANDYMQTVTGFSAALISSVSGDTEKAAELANTAITDMADNSNKMGTSLESLQNAYTGFSRGNFTMLDNLALGFSGTKEGMQELLDKAHELSGVEFDINSYADIVEAIHIVQTEMDISGISIEEYNELISSGAMTAEEAFELLGTTAKESSSTISGSVASMKAAWSNLIVGMADDNADFEQLTKDFVESVTTAGENIIPRIETTLQGVSNLVSAASSTLIPLVIDTLMENLPQLIVSGVKLVVAIIAGLLKAIPQLVKAIPEIVDAVIDALKEAWPQIRDAGSGIVEVLKQGILSAWEGFKNFVSGLWEGIKSIFTVNASDVNIAATNLGAGAAGGLDYVPYNGYVTQLHRGEMVLTAREAREWRNSRGKPETETIQPVTIPISVKAGETTIAEKVYKFNIKRSNIHGSSLIAGTA